MLATFIPYFTFFSVGLYLRITFLMVYQKKDCCFSTFAQYNKPNITQFKLTDLGKRFRASIW